MVTSSFCCGDCLWEFILRTTNSALGVAENLTKEGLESDLSDEQVHLCQNKALSCELGEKNVLHAQNVSDEREVVAGR